MSATYARGAAGINLSFNNSPVVTKVKANPSALSTALDVDSTDDDGDALEYQWSDGGGQCAGSFSPNATVKNPVWTAPASAPEGTECVLSVTVGDGRGGRGRVESPSRCPKAA
ncbi:Ig-like domain-containing protein [Cystobacter fuscus]